MEERKLGRFDAFMVIICGIMFADTIASNSSAGVPAITWWLILGVLYMIPTGLIVGELSGFLPDEGGIYVWIYEGLGPKWAALTSWLFFTCGLFIPVSSFVMSADVLFSVMWPAAPLLARVGLAIVLVWLLTWVSTMPMAEAQWIVNAAGVIKLVLYVGVFLAGVTYLMGGHVPANEMSAATLVPTVDESLEFLPIIVFCCTGMELASASANEMDDPSRMLPRVVVGTAALAVLLNVISCFGLLSVTPVSEIDLNYGLMGAISTGFGAPWLYAVVAVLFLLAIFAQCLTWMVGSNRGTAESAKAGDLPAFLGKETASGQPLGAILTTSIASTVLLVVYAFTAETASDLFFALFSCGVIGSLVPYVFMIVAYQRLRKTEAYAAYEGFRCPGGLGLSWLVQVIQCATLFLMVYIPGVGFSSDVVTNVGGFLAMTLTGAVAIWWAGRERAGE